MLSPIAIRRLRRTLIPPTEPLKGRNIIYADDTNFGLGEFTIGRDDATTGSSSADFNVWRTRMGAAGIGKEITSLNVFFVDGSPGRTFDEDTIAHVVVSAEAPGDSSFSIDEAGSGWTLLRSNFSQCESIISLWLLQDGYDAAYTWNNPPPRVSGIRYDIGTFDVKELADASLPPGVFQNAFEFSMTRYRPLVGKPVADTVYYNSYRIFIPAGTVCGGFELGAEIHYATTINTAKQGVYDHRVFSNGNINGQGTATGPWDNLGDPDAWVLFARFDRRPFWDGIPAADYWPI